MSIHSIAANLAQGLKSLTFEWQQTLHSWDDQKSTEFQSTHLDPLPPQIARTASAITELEKILRQAKSDCE